MKYRVKVAYDGGLDPQTDLRIYAAAGTCGASTGPLTEADMAELRRVFPVAGKTREAIKHVLPTRVVLPKELIQCLRNLDIRLADRRNVIRADKRGAKWEVLIGVDESTLMKYFFREEPGIVCLLFADALQFAAVKKELEEAALKPSIGRIVIYNHPGSADGTHPPTQSPAIIQAVLSETKVRVHVFGPKGTHIDEIEQGDGPCQWNWPPRV